MSTSTIADEMILCLIAASTAHRLGNAAAVAGGWIAADPLDALIVDVVYRERTGREGALLALLPACWPEARRNLGADAALAMASRLSPRRAAQVRAAVAEGCTR